MTLARKDVITTLTISTLLTGALVKPEEIILPQTKWIRSRIFSWENFGEEKMQMRCGQVSLIGIQLGYQPLSTPQRRQIRAPRGIFQTQPEAPIAAVNCANLNRMRSLSTSPRFIDEMNDFFKVCCSSLCYLRIVREFQYGTNFVSSIIMIAASHCAHPVGP